MKHDEYILNDKNGRFLLKTYFSSALPRKNQFRIHHHAECELCTILRGRGLYRVKDKTYSFAPGDIFLFSGDEEHCITDLEEPGELLNIHFTPRLLWADDICLSGIFFARSNTFENKIDPDHPLTPGLVTTARKIAQELSEKAPGYRTMAKARLLEMITDLVRHYGYVDTTVDHQSFYNKIGPMEAALSYIEEHLTHDMTLAQIAEAANMSHTYFSTVFRKLNGISPWEYITARRIELAIELLATTNMTKLDIAMRCGFNSSSNFYKAFFHVTGKTPGDYGRHTP